MYKLESEFWWYKGLHDLVERCLKTKSSNSIDLLDAGCGTGRVTEILKKYGNVKGIDYSEEAINFCKKRGLNNIAIGDLNDWNPKGEKYDIIVCLDVLYHSGIKDDTRILNKFYEILKRRGILILNLPAFNFLKCRHDILVYTRERYRKNPTIKMLKDIGFTIKKATYRLPYLFFIIIFKKIIERINTNDETSSDLKPLPAWLNSLLFLLNRLENKLILSGINIPFGSSLFIIAEKS